MKAAHVLPRAKPKEVHDSLGRYNPRHCINYDTADLYLYIIICMLFISTE